MNTFTINGKTYNSIDEMPPDVRAQFEQMSSVFADKNQNGVPDVIENVMSAGATVIQTSAIVYDGKTYTNVDELPVEARAQYEQAMGKLADANRDGIPDVIENVLQTAPTLTATPARVVLPTTPSSNLGPVIVLSIISIGLAIIVGILLLLVLNR